MLENADLTKTISKEDYKQKIEPLRKQLSNLQHRVKDEKLPVVILLEGWSAAGKGCVLSDIVLTLDPRNFQSKSTLAPTPDEARKPFLWRHWNSLPPRGIMGIYDRSWYPEVITGWMEQGAGRKSTMRRLGEINTFERQLANDGTLIIKIFLHIGKKQQKQRFDKLAAKKNTAWRVDAHNYARNRRYHEFFKAYDEMLEATNTQSARWHIVCGGDRQGALAEVYGILVDSITAALEKKEAADKAFAEQKAAGPAAVDETALSGGDFSLLRMPTLADVPLTDTLADEKYEQELKKCRKRLARLHNEIYQNKIPVIIAYEGWDAAGKGGNIRRLTSGLDPRGYDVVPIASPTPTELSHPFLWRFWAHLPRDGHIAIFDRTWYGRVMVERVEGFARPDEWQRAYREINEFEQELARWGAVVLKFWLQIDKDEQLRRFNARKDDPEKNWKLTDEDWRNREKWDLYEAAINDMLRLTSTAAAPWTIVESQDKKYARIKVMKTVIEAIESRLDGYL